MRHKLRPNMRVLMVTQFYPPVAGGQEQHVRNLATALVGRGHHVEVATIAVDGPAGTSLDGDLRVHRIRTTAQHLPQLYSDPVRPHAMPIVDPGFRRAIGKLLGTGRFDVLHAHDWSIGSAIGPARRAGVPLVLTQHDYSHVCATKRLMRGDAVCPGPTPAACVRCASSWHGPVVGPAVALANALSRHTRTRHVDAFIPVSSVVAVSTRLPGRSPYTVIPNFIPDDLVLDEAAPHPDGPIVFVGDLSRDKGIEVLIEAHRRLGGRPHLVLAGRVFEDTPVDLPEQVELRGLLDHPSVIDTLADGLCGRRSLNRARLLSNGRPRGNGASGDRSSPPQVEGSSTWWTTAPRDSSWLPATPSPCPVRSQQSSTTATARR